MNILENETIINLTDKYNQLSGRDKILTQFLTVFVILCIGYFALYNPSVNAKIKANEQLNQTQKTYRDIQKVVPQIIQAKQNAVIAQQTSRPSVNNINKSMTAMVNDSSKKFAIIIDKSSSEGNDAINLSGKDQIFDQLIRFMGDVNTSYGLTIETYSIKQTDVSGKVDFNIKIKR
ncbi:type II secretion system protein GspM [Marinicellulosiphila megalodicopiae]|uniref:type II secretion system protein GspM n=1 Tax=Marinicellulosiphila megalodicopiae TaxID=2724896 RepID=UPI003BB0EB04